ncbi:MAG: transcription elongation factor GreA [Minisyncoccota bacterium]
MNEKEYLTKEKFDEFKKELEYLKSVKRKEVAEQLEYAKSLGDLSENAEYHEARDAQAITEDRIAKLEGIMKSAIIITENNTGTVNVGSEITVEKNGKKVDYMMVGTEEADALSGKISIRSPFGQAVIGKKKGDSFTFDAPSGSVTYKVTDIK